MDVTRGDRVLCYRQEVEVLEDPYTVVRIRHPTGNIDVVSVDNLSPLPPDVVTLTLSYRGHEGSRR